MSTNSRPFFANFLSAFRTQSTIQKVASTQSSAVTGTTLQTSYGHSSPSTSSSTSQSNPTTAGPRSISTRSSTTTTTSSSSSQGPSGALQAARQLQSPRQHSTSASYSRSPGSPPGPAGFSSRQRRGSDSSNEGGFRDARNAEKLYIGGRTATGEEKFYKLSMVKRPASIDRLSVDRMSL